MKVDEAELRTFAFRFVEACFSLLREQGLLPDVPGRYLTPGRDYSDWDFRELSEFKVLYDYLSHDERIRGIYEVIEGALVDIRVSEYIAALVRGILRETEGNLSTQVFDDWFNRFRAELFAGTVRIKTIWFLENFTCAVRQFALDDQVEMLYFDVGALQHYLARDIDPWSYFKLGLLEGHALVATHIVDKKTLPGAHADAQITQKLSSIITALRLLKGGYITFRHALYVEISRFWTNPTFVQYSVWGHGMEPEYELDSSEIGALGTLWKEVYQLLYAEEAGGTTKNKLRLAIAYFESSYERNRHDTFVDLAVCLDALLDGNGKVVKLKERTSTLLAVDAITKEQIERDIATIYALRSKVVHGQTMSDMEFKRSLGELVGIPNANLDFHQAESAIEKARDYDRRLIRAVIRLVLDGGAELNRELYARLDHARANPQANLALQRLAGIV